MRAIRQALRKARHALAGFGPRHPLVLSTLWAYGAGRGFQVVPVSGGIALRQGRRLLILRDADFTFVELMIHGLFDTYFETIEPERVADTWVLDFSRPRVHRYRRLGVDLLFPGIPEDDDIDGYTHAFAPGEGMVVFDVGAHAGLTPYVFSQMVGPTGRVYAFEPDRGTRHYLEVNVGRLGLSNVVICDAALGDRSGRAVFNMDASLSAGLLEFLPHPDTGFHQEVEVMTLEDACGRFGRVPDFAKLDIEGAEVAVITSALRFLSQHPIAFAIASYHRDKSGDQTYFALEPAFQSIGYRVESSDQYGYMHTWALPPSLLEPQDLGEPASLRADRAAPTTPELYPSVPSRT